MPLTLKRAALKSNHGLHGGFDQAFGRFTRDGTNAVIPVEGPLLPDGRERNAAYNSAELIAPSGRKEGADRPPTWGYN